MLYNPRPGSKLVSEYQISAIPWVTSSAINGVVPLSFQFVSSFVCIRNTGSPTLRVSFTRNGLSFGNYFDLAQNISFAADIRTKVLFLSSSNGTAEIIAGLTGIMPSDMPDLTGSNGYQGVG